MPSKSTFYRRRKRAKKMGCSVDDLPDGRGKHLHHASGGGHYRWNNGVIINKQGYRLLRVGPEHPLADPNGYAKEHALIWVSAGNSLPATGRCLHHRNGNRGDNRLANLMEVRRGEHNRIHNTQRGQRADGTFTKAAGRVLDGKTHDARPNRRKEKDDE